MSKLTKTGWYNLLAYTSIFVGFPYFIWHNFVMMNYVWVGLLIFLFVWLGGSLFWGEKIISMMMEMQIKYNK